MQTHAPTKQTHLKSGLRSLALCLGTGRIEARGWGVSGLTCDAAPLRRGGTQGHAQLTERLGAGADFNFCSPTDGRSALHLASAHGDNASVIILVEAGADMDASSSLQCPSCRINPEPIEYRPGGSKTALMEAIVYGHLAVVETLCFKGADIELILQDKSAIEYAAVRGDNGIMIVLLDKAEDPKLDIALLLASAAGHFDVAETLLINGADPEQYEETPLYCAAERGDDAMVMLLLEHKANVDWHDPAGQTPLQVAVMGGHLPTVEALLNAEADLYRALRMAVLFKKKVIMKAILDCNNARQYRDELEDAMWNLEYDEASVEIVLALLDKNVPVNITSCIGNTPLHVAVGTAGCSEAAVDLLLRRGADESMKDNEGRTPADVLANNSELAPAAAERIRQLLYEAQRRRLRWCLVKLRVLIRTRRAAADGSEGVRPVHVVVRLGEEGLFRKVVSFL